MMRVFTLPARSLGLTVRSQAFDAVTNLEMPLCKGAKLANQMYFLFPVIVMQ